MATVINNNKSFMKQTVIVEPYELTQYAEEKYGWDNAKASHVVWQISPECECKTFDYSVEKVEFEIKFIHDTYDVVTDEDTESYKMLLDFMKDNNITAFTLTQ